MSIFLSTQKVYTHISAYLIIYYTQQTEIEELLSLNFFRIRLFYLSILFNFAPGRGYNPNDHLRTR